MHQKVRRPLLGYGKPALAVLAIAVVLASSLIAMTRPAHQAVAAANNAINFQARLMTNSGSIVPDGYYNVQFNLYTASTGGSSQWTETWYDSNGVTAGNDNRIRVQNGYLTASLGTQNAFPTTINWEQQQWITMNIGGVTQTATPTWDGEMTPRLLLTAVPYAFRASQLAAVAGSFSGSLQFASTYGQNSTITLPDPGASTATVCYQSSTSCGFVTGSASSFIQNGTGLQSAASFNIASSTATSPVGALQAAASATAPVLLLKGGATPGTNGDLLQLQNSGGSVLASFSSTAALTLGRSAVTGTLQTGSAIFVDGSSTSGFANTLTTVALTGSHTISLPDAGGTICTTVAATCSSVYSAAGGSYILKNAQDTSTAAVASAALLAFSNTNTGASRGLDVTSAGTDSTLQVTGSGNPTTTGSATLKVNNTNGTPSGNLFDLQTGGVSKFTVSTAGQAVLAGGQTPDITTAGATTATALTLQPGTSSGASSNGPALNLNGGSASGTTSATGGAVSIQGGNATGASGTRNGGAVTIDGGTGATVNGAVNIGGTNAPTVNIGSVGSTAKATAIHIGDTTTTTAGAIQTVTIGSNSNLAHTTTIQGGSGTTAISLTPQTTGGIVIGASAGTGTITLGQSTASNTVNIGSADFTAANTQTVNIANGLQTTAASTFNVNILSNAGNGTSGTARLNLANSDRVTQVDIGNVAADAARTLNLFTGNSGVVDTLNIGTGATTVAGGKTIHIGDGTPTGSGTNLITIGSITALGNTTTIQGGSGSGAVSVQAATSGTVAVGTTNANTVNIGGTNASTITTVQGGGGVNIGNGGTTGAVQIGNTTGGVAQTINIGTNATSGATNTVNIGSGTVAGTTTVNAGTGAGNLITLQGNNATGGVKVKSATNSTAAFLIQDSGTNNYLSVDTSGAAIGIGYASSTATLNGTVKLATVGTATANSQLLCRDSTTNILTACTATVSGNAFVQGGNSFGATALLGTNDTNNLQIETNGGVRATFDQSYNLYLGNGITSATPSGFTVSATGSSAAGTTGSGLTLQGGAGASATTGSAGGNLSLAGGNAGGTGNNVGGTVLLQGGSATGSGAAGTVLVKNLGNSTSAFQVQNTGGNAVLSVDAQNSRVGINVTGTPTSALQVTGTFRLDGTTTELYTTPAASPSNVPTKINIPNFDPGSFGQVVALGLPSTAQTTARVISLFDARTTSHQPTIAVFNPLENNAAGISWNGSNTQSWFMTMDQSGTADSMGAGVKSGDTSGSGNSGALTLQSGAVTGGTGMTTGTVSLVSGSGSGTNSSSGNVTIDSGAKTGTGTNGAINIGTTNATTINVGTNAIAHAIGIGTGAAVQGVTVGSQNSTSTTIIQGGSTSTGVGAISVQAATSGLITIGTTNNNTVNIGGASSTTTLSGTVQVSSLSAVAAGSQVVCRDVATGKLTTCDANLNALPFVQGGNSFAATAVLGTNDANNIQIKTNNVVRATFDQSNNLYLGLGATAAAPTAAVLGATSSSAAGAAGAALTIQGGAGASATTGSAGGVVTIAGGNAGGTGNNVGGTVVLQGGSATGTGTKGGVLVKNAADSAAAFQVQNAAGTATTLDVDTANGRVGVGTAAPTRQLHLSVATTATNALPLLVEQTGTGDTGIEFKTSSKNFYAGIDNTDGMFKIGSAASANGTSTMGDTTIEASNDNNANGAQAYQVTAGTTGAISSVSVYITSLDGTPANRNVQFGIYSSKTTSCGASATICPDQLLGSSVSQTAIVGWNTLSISGASVVSGTTYWIAMAENGSNSYAINGGGGVTSYRLTTGYPLPTTYGNNSANSTVKASFYATIISSSSTDNFNAPLFRLSDTGSTTFQNAIDSTAAFQVQRADSTNLLYVDTTNSKLTLGVTGTSALTGQVSIGTSTGATQIVNIGSDFSGQAANGTSILVQGGNQASAVAIQSLASGTISIGTAAAGNVTIGNASGTVTLQGGTTKLSTVGATTANAATLCRDTTTTNLISCDANTTGKPFLQGGNTFGATASLGTNDTNNLTVKTNNVVRATFDQSNNLYLGLGVTNAAPTLFAIQATGSSTAGTAGAQLTVQGGAGMTTGTGSAGGNLLLAGGASAGGSGNNAGGIVTLQGGAATNTGTAGYVLVKNSQNGATAFQVQDASSNALFTVATGQRLVMVGTTQGGTLTTTPAFMYLSDVPNNAAGNAQITGQWQSSANWGLGPNSNANDNTLRFGVTTGNPTSTAGNTWNTSGANLNLLVAGTVRITPNSTNDSLTAFQVQRASGNGAATVFDVDTTNSRVGIGTNTPSTDLAFGGASNRVISVETQGTTNTAGASLTVRGATGNGTGAGGAVTIQGGTGGSTGPGGGTLVQGGNAGGGNTNGGDLTVTGGTGSGTGIKGVVNIGPLVFAAASTQSFTNGGTITQANVDNFATVVVGETTTAGATVTLPDPTNTTAGRTLYVTSTATSLDFALTANSGALSIAMRKNATATMIWNGVDWTPGGADSSTTLQAAYNNTLVSAGGAEIVLNNNSNTGGLTIRDNATTPITGSLFEVQSSIATNLFSVSDLSTELAANGGGEDSTNFATNWTAAPAGGTITRTTTTGNYATGQAGVQIATAATAAQGVRNNLATNPAASSTYQVSFTAKAATTNFSTLDITYTRDGGTTFAGCATGQSVITTSWTKITCTFTTDGTTATNPDLIIRQSDATSRTFYIDNLSVALAAASGGVPADVQIGGGINGGQITLFTLDRSAGAPVSGSNAAYLGSLYYDTAIGRIQCYESDGWGSCGSAPDNIIILTPEFAGATLDGSGIGTMTSDFCANQTGVLSVNSTLCGTGEGRNFYQWTSPQGTQQIYSIYLSYKLPSTFKNFSDDNTIQLTGRTDDTTNGVLSYELFKSTGSAITACGTETTVTSTVNTWQTVSHNGNENTTCGFAGGNTVVFKINVKSQNNANVYVGNLTFTYTNN